MLLLLSPAKNLDLTDPPPKLKRTQPALMDETKTLLTVAKKFKRTDLKRLMEISDKLADLNWQRFQDFDANAKPDKGKQAILAFNGDVYRGLDAKTLSPADFEYAQDHVRMLSGLYGLLKPLDAIQPYRLEMGTKVHTKRGEDLYDFWGPRISQTLDTELDAKHKFKTVVNLASDEYFSAVDTKALKAPVITCVFHEIKDGKSRAIFLYAKLARGMMARFAIDARAKKPEDLQAFDTGGYKFDKKASTDTLWMFSRKQPPPLAGAKKKA